MIIALIMEFSALSCSECSVLFFFCVICTAGILEWPFWTKLVVVAIGFTGGLVFMYVQCKVYIHLWRRLKAYNRVIYVQNRPDTCKKLLLEKPPLTEPSMESKEALAPAQSDTNSSQYTETEDYSMEVLHVWPLGPLHRLSGSYYIHPRAHGKACWLRNRPDAPHFSDARPTHTPPVWPYTSLRLLSLSMLWSSRNFLSTCLFLL